MINVVIIEDESCASEKLMDSLKEVSIHVNVVAVLTSVKESIAYFKAPNKVDLIFSDVQLPDGLSFSIFNDTGISIPVIFITGFDKFILYAFESNGIDYLLKPVYKDELNKALTKYTMLSKHFSERHNPLEQLLETLKVKKRTRMIVRKGIENISVRMEDIALLYTENKLVYLVDRYGKKFMVDKTMNELETELDEATFFRANRQYIVNLSFVKSYKPYEKVKLQIDLNVPELNHFIVISQLSAPHFRKWISEA